MKKFLAIVMCMVMALSMVACGGQEDADANTENNVNTESNVNTEQQGEVPSTEVEETDVVKETAMAYFANFADDRNVISPADLFAKIDAGEDMVILDIRQADAYTEEHLKGAVNLPYGATLAESVELIPDDVPVYVNCYTGQTSSQTVALLRMAGKYAYNIQGGYTAISATENYANYADTEVYTLPDAVYEVDDEMEAAIVDYYTAATTGTFSSFNFPVDSLKELVEAESDAYTILSVRQAEDYAAGHIAGAINIPFGKNMQESFSQIPTDKPVVVYCYTGQTASQVIGVLRMLGYEAYNLSGGMGSVETGKGWLGAGLPVVTE